MILADDFLEYLNNTERDLYARVLTRYEKYKLSLPEHQLREGDIDIEGRYIVRHLIAGYGIYRVTGREHSLLTICQSPSGVITEIVADSLRLTHHSATPEETLAETQRLCRVIANAALRADRR
ncbi:hypothetical protein ACRWTT_24290 [Escherichia coli]|uniref:Uncharacterized protein n=3 Tax=Escherichia coli TaxID=562 RepID=A0A2J7L6C0_ECOLX|nr:hypothetical protein [Escherichia coli]EFH5310958.1 hypothetical protein [Escherichia coli]EFL4151659.1 hypothetical protein [Escherichia coli]EGS3065206.1 hypothetical protein [Escherichia coli]EHV4506690.1 hypothetical protein [Escherichia coli]EIJ2905141.1 hypothetical protein [Escherichia coli]